MIFFPVDRQSIDDSEQILHADLPPLIPEPVEHMHFTPSVSITPAPDTVVPQKAIRPNQLNLEGPIRPARHLKPPTSLIDTPMRRPISPGSDKMVSILIKILTMFCVIIYLF